uniref:Uncharacterized protein n=1 Tax=Ananas comosus var. bracteatus TaxID=296719 RepID=A0A6V7PT76_ANACO|nr:unnamed protein product [Ananas comosus var. bracteatus]
MNRLLIGPCFLLVRVHNYQPRQEVLLHPRGVHPAHPGVQREASTYTSPCPVSAEGTIGRTPYKHQWSGRNKGNELTRWTRKRVRSAANANANAKARGDGADAAREIGVVLRWRRRGVGGGVYLLYKDYMVAHDALSRQVKGLYATLDERYEALNQRITTLESIKKAETASHAEASE